MNKTIYAFLASGLTILGVSILASVVIFSQPTYACEDDSSQDDTPEEVAVDYSDDIYITEVLPNPSGEESTDEFIELYNSSNNAVDLTGWELSDSTSRNYTLTGSIGAGQYTTFYREASGIALNNSGDTVELYQPDGTLLDIIEYTDSADEEVSYALSNDGDWYWTTTVTAGRSNTITEFSDSTEEDPGDTENSEGDENTENTDDANEADDSEDDLQGYDFSNDIELSELLPDPEGSDVTDEWIEIHNVGSSAVDMYGWQVADASKTYTISESIELAANGYMVLSVIDTSVSLNNSGDTIYLYDPASDIMDEVTYEDSDPGSAYARSNSTWNWTTSPTPGEANTIVVATADSTTADTTTTASPTGIVDSGETIEGETSGTISIEAAKQLSKGDDVVVQGTVNVLPGIFGTQYFYIQDETSGVQIYSSQKEFPELAVGDVVQVTGKLSEASGEIKINTTDIVDIVVQSHEDTLAAVEVTDYTESQLGMLVQISGEVTEKSGSTIVFDTGWSVYVKRSTGLSTTAFIEGEHVTVVGVLTASDDGIRVLPRGEVDLTTITTETASSDKVTASTSFIPEAKASTSESSNNVLGAVTENKTMPNYWWAIILIGICVSLVAVSRSQKLSSLARNWFSRLVHSLATRYGLLVDLGKNAKDSVHPIPHHVPPTSNKKRS